MIDTNMRLLFHSKLCCPPDYDVPTCGWYNHNNGKCDNQCPSGSVEIGSNDKYCEKKSYSGTLSVRTYQAACCSTDTDSMQLYSQCSWSGWPLCQASTCDKSTVAHSPFGSGDAICHGVNDDYISEDNAFKAEYCCDQDDDDSKWSECAWYGGPKSNDPIGYCSSTCPSGLVRVSMDQSGCAGGSARARCCKPDYKTLHKRQSDEDEKEELLLDRKSTHACFCMFYEAANVYLLTIEFLNTPVCTNPDFYDGNPFNSDSTTGGYSIAGSRSGANGTETLHIQPRRLADLAEAKHP